MAGYQGNSSLISSSVQYVLNVVMTVPGLFIVDRVGRRPVLLVGSALMMVWLLVSGIVLAVYGVSAPSVDGNPNIRIYVPADKKSISKVIIAFAYLFVSSFSVTWGPTIWIYCSEIFPLRQRARANGLCAAFNWLANFALAMFFPSAFTNITWKAYILFSVFNFVAFFHVFFLFPETKGKSLEEIDQIWEGGIPAWKSASFVPDQPSMDDCREFSEATHSDPEFHPEEEIALKSAVSRLGV